MPTQFRFSVGDFFNRIEFLIDIMQNLSDANGARPMYQELARELQNLQKSLECLQILHLQSTNPAQLSDVNNAVDSCRLCVENFAQKNSKFSSLYAKPAKKWTLKTFQSQLRKIQAALFKKGDVKRFRDEFRLHSNTMQMKLTNV